MYIEVDLHISDDRITNIVIDYSFVSIDDNLSVGIDTLPYHDWDIRAVHNNKYIYPSYEEETNCLVFDRLYPSDTIECNGESILLVRYDNKWIVGIVR